MKKAKNAVLEVLKKDWQIRKRKCCPVCGSPYIIKLTRTYEYKCENKSCKKWVGKTPVMRDILHDTHANGRTTSYADILRICKFHEENPDTNRNQIVKELHLGWKITNIYWDAYKKTLTPQ